MSAARGWELKRKVRIAAAKTPRLPGRRLLHTVSPDLRERGRDLECWERERDSREESLSASVPVRVTLLR